MRVTSRSRPQTALEMVVGAGPWKLMPTPPNGAFRGFGAPQVEFAAEIQLGRVAEALGIAAGTVKSQTRDALARLRLLVPGLEAEPTSLRTG